jgi:large-conductance mechanosensitive channel
VVDHVLDLSVKEVHRLTSTISRRGIKNKKQLTTKNAKRREKRTAKGEQHSGNRHVSLFAFLSRIFAFFVVDHVLDLSVKVMHRLKSAISRRASKNEKQSTTKNAKKREKGMLACGYWSGDGHFHLSAFLSRFFAFFVVDHVLGLSVKVMHRLKSAISRRDINHEKPLTTKSH